MAAVDPGVAGAAGCGKAAEAFSGQIRQGEVDDGVTRGDARGRGHAVTVAAWL